ncbi:G4 quadruplex nucleic acid binding protein [Mycoemilia scoparia]|uniref:G4 quadruplex nucleic acid binding protein n=1 Tax=Mycoemilia scoparia TaxID=417184 RepID=A0A9W8DQ89_9FUNG|nr:G4 quadruplex nucleic acid binding protein [Mycoemilia scoparia]
MSQNSASNDKAIKLLQEYIAKTQNIKDTQSLESQLSGLSIGGEAPATNTAALALVEKYNKELSGKSSEDAAKVNQWLTMSARTGLTERQTLTQELNKHLELQTYIVSNYITVADIVTFANVHAYMESLSPQKRFNINHFSRWFDLIQNTLSADTLKAAGLTKIEIDLNAPKPAGASAAAAGAPKEKAAKGEKSEKGGKKEKKEKKPKQEAAPLVIVPSMIDLRVGRINNAKKHPDADALYVEEIDCGEEEPRTVVSGLVKYVPLEEMQNRDCIVVCNLKPVAMRGIKSYAMVLCATSPDGAKVELVEPPKGSKPGDRIVVEGYEEGEPEKVLNPKKKIFETIQPGYLTSEDRVAGWFDENKKFHRLLVNGQECKPATIALGTMK